MAQYILGLERELDHYRAMFNEENKRNHDLNIALKSKERMLAKYVGFLLRNLVLGQDVKNRSLGGTNASLDAICCVQVPQHNAANSGISSVTLASTECSTKNHLLVHMHHETDF